jgi:hypothetical protein
MISTVLLALTKLHPEGNWIKSMFDLPGQAGSVNEGPDVVNITLLEPKLENNKIVGDSKKSMRIQKDSLTRLAGAGVRSDQITEPWQVHSRMQMVHHH